MSDVADDAMVDPMVGEIVGQRHLGERLLAQAGETVCQDSEIVRRQYELGQEC